MTDQFLWFQVKWTDAKMQSGREDTLENDMQ